MIESHRPRLTADALTALLRRELETHAAAAPAGFDLDDIETLLRAAEERSRPRTQLPPQLNRFPLSRSPWLQQLILKVYKRLFHDQRAVNTVLIQALRETLAVNRYLLTALAERDRGLPRLLAPPDGGPQSCAS
jgi:hypothetical protein